MFKWLKEKKRRKLEFMQWVDDAKPFDIITYNMGVHDGWREPYPGVLSIHPYTKELRNFLCHKGAVDWSKEDVR